MDFNIKSSTLSGRKAHIWQRLSAIYLLFYTPFLAIVITQLPSSVSLKLLAYQLDSLAFSGPFEVASLIAVLLLLVHAWVGVRDIIIDYVPREKVNLWLTLYHGILILLFINSAMIAINLFGYA
ncbi:MAG: succinate dehydrogenase, hydrophobic membrane anchor protein [Thiomicrorhabdus sp.]|nr:succinate dehydrogenase, hydrophobic membrane anchor protein [Thiomicrorhabdus sp.]